jgi:hypothetical protein
MILPATPHVELKPLATLEGEQKWRPEQQRSRHTTAPRMAREEDAPYEEVGPHDQNSGSPPQEAQSSSEWLFPKEVGMLSKLSSLFHSWTRGWLILALFAAFVVFEAVTLPLLQAAPGGSIVALDAQVFYTPEEAFSTVASYGDAARFWSGIYLTWDVVNPILYTLAFSLLISWLFQRSFKARSKLHKLNVLPVGAGLFDLLENICIVTLLTVYPAQPAVVASLSSVCTMSKVSLLGMSTVLILVGLVKAAMNRFTMQRRLTAKT